MHNWYRIITPYISGPDTSWKYIRASINLCNPFLINDKWPKIICLACHRIFRSQRRGSKQLQVQMKRFRFIDRWARRYHVMFDSLNEDCSSEYIGFAIAAVITILLTAHFQNLKSIRSFQSIRGEYEPRP